MNFNLNRGQWAVLIVFFLTLMLVTGPLGASLAVLFTPWMRSFHWNHAQVGQIASAVSLTGGLMSPLVGWLVDRIGAHRVMGFGFILIGICYILASHAHSHEMMVALYAVIGLGSALTGFLPLMVVFINWFDNRRGMASSVASVGMSVGLTMTPPLMTWAVGGYGWRIAIRGLAVAPIVILLPLTLLMVRTRPANAAVRNRAQELALLPGLDVGPALRTLTFWLLMACQLFAGLGTGLVLPHQIAYLIGVGYTPEHAAWIYSTQTAVNGFGILITGWLSDRFSPQMALGVAQISLAISVGALLGAANGHWAPMMIPIFALLWGSGAGCFNNLLPILLAETIGVRRLGTLIGFKFLAQACAMGVGPWLSGRLFDLTGSYTVSFLIGSVSMVLTALAVSLVREVPGHDVIPTVAAAPLSASAS
jgi:MFS family permease